MAMKTLLLPLLGLCAGIVAGQADVFQLAIDPAGADSIVVFSDGLVTSDGGTRILGGFENAPVPAFTLCAYDVHGQFQWGQKVAATSTGAQLEPRKLVRLSTGELIVFGIWANGGSHAYFLSRLSAEGALQWIRTYRPGSGGSDYGFSSVVATSDDQLVVSMGLIDRTVAMRLTADGDVLWANEYVTDDSPTNKNPGFDFTATPDGGVMLTQKAEDDIFLIRLTGDGSVDWARRHPNGGYCHTHSALLLEDGGFLISGSRDAVPFAARTDQDGHMIWQKQYAFDEGLPEAFGRAVELADGDLLLTPSRASVGIMGLRISPLGAPVSARTMDGDGYAKVLGRHEDRILFGGRAWVQVDNGTSDAMLLLATPTDLSTGCLNGSTGVIAEDIPIPTPVNGCTVVAEAILEDTIAVYVENILFGARPLCTPIAGQQDQHAPLFTLFPSVITSGDPIQIRTAMNAHVHRVEINASDGRSERIALLTEQAGATQQVPTTGLPSGMHLVRALDRRGVVLHTERFAIH